MQTRLFPARRCIANAMQGGFSRRMPLVSRTVKRTRADGVAERFRLTQQSPQEAKSAAGQAVSPPATAGAVSGVPVAGRQKTTIHTFAVNREDGNPCLHPYISTR